MNTPEAIGLHIETMRAKLTGQFSEQD